MTANVESLITALVQQAPALDAETITALVGELRARGTPLADTIARVVELVRDRRVDAGIALPALAMACATLCDPRATTRELEAARYEIDTLIPLAKPDVLLADVSRGPRPRT